MDLVLDEYRWWMVDKMENVMILLTLNDSNNSATLKGIYIDRSGGYHNILHISPFHSDEQM